MKKHALKIGIKFTYRGEKGMSARLMELIDVNTIKIMAEQFYKLTNMAHQLLDAERECIFSFGIDQEIDYRLTTIEIPIFLDEQYLGAFIACPIKKDMVYCQKYFETLSSLIVNHARTQLQNQNQNLQLLAKEKEQLYTILQNMPVMVDALDLDGEFILWNRECKSVTGYTAEEMIGNQKLLNYYIQMQTIVDKSKKSLPFTEEIFEIGK